MNIKIKGMSLEKFKDNFEKWKKKWDSRPWYMKLGGWVASLLKNKFADHYWNFCRGVLNFVFFGKEIYEHRWWDHAYMYEMILKMLKYRYRIFHKGMSVNALKDKKNIGRAIRCLQVIRELDENFTKDGVEIRGKAYLDELDLQWNRFHDILKKHARAWWD